MLGKLLLLFTVVPLVELYLLLFIGDLVGFWPTVGIVLFTGALGAWLAKREGLRVYRKWQEALAAYRMPEEGVLGGVLVLIGGVLLVTPGVLTDLVGFLLLLPPSRRWIAGVVRRRMERRIADGSIHVVTYTGGSLHEVGRRRSGPPGVIDVEGEVVEERSDARPDATPRRLGGIIDVET